MSHLHRFLPFLFGNKKGQSYKLPQSLEWGSLCFEELLMFHTLDGSLEEFLLTLDQKNLTILEIYHLFGFVDFLPQGFLKELKKNYQKEWELFLDSTLRHHELHTKNLQEILNFKSNKLTVFALMHKDRTRPGKIFVRKADGSFIHKNDGSVWSIPVLGLSGRGLDFNHSNGATPCGVFTIDSVMPEANRNYDFGKFRRLIVNFIPKSDNEKIIKDFLPTTHHNRIWWSPSLVARELGRSLLRIHGTGAINKKMLSPYFPMIATSGCLATNEVKILGLWEKNDQRALLDCLMQALGLPKTFENESKIHGLLYVVDFDGKYQALEFKRESDLL